MAHDPAVARLAAGIGSIVLVAATLSPVLRSPHDDDYPLSTFPMFASRRPTKLTISYAVGDTAGGPRYLSPRVVGTGEVLQARAQIDSAVRGGKVRSAALCAQIAARVAADDDFADVQAIRIVTGTHDAVEFLIRHEPGTLVERARCGVPR